MKLYIVALLSALVGASGVYYSNVRHVFEGYYSLERGYYDNWHEFHAFSCERTKANSDAYFDGVQRFNVHTGPSIATLAHHVAEVDGMEETASADWHKQTVWIDYLKNHEVCVKNMGFGVDTCFDLYELGER